ncbi:uncharacterized protein [Amphiura filiformis]|uniref:uncharacterized protein isoform X2 n=1 Tax=Amphiura filiformis TaxID=82378 RepID=UPI003B211278
MEYIYKDSLLLLLLVAFLGHLSFTEVDGQTLPVCDYLTEDDVQNHANTKANTEFVRAGPPGPGIHFTLTPETLTYSTGDILTVTLTPNNLGNGLITTVVVQAFEFNSRAVCASPIGQWSSDEGVYLSQCPSVSDTIYLFTNGIRVAKNFRFQVMGAPGMGVAGINIEFRATVAVTANGIETLYYGVTSSPVSPVSCPGVACQNGGVCNNGFCSVPCPVCQNGGFCACGVCNCVNGYSGDSCERAPQNPCPGICQNGGFCSNGVCSCINGYSGTLCETAPCPGICLNGGFCSNGVCSCVNGYYGTLCGTAPACPGTCLNGGVCSNGVCSCANGFSGTLCETVLSSACDPNPCFNGGICFANASDTRTSYFCECPQAWTGLVCGLPEDACNDPDNPNVCNGGDCFMSEAGMYVCVNCPDGSMPPNNTPCPGSPCDGNPCENGECTVAGASFTCMCNNGWTKGDNSEICNVQGNPCDPPNTPCGTGECFQSVLGNGYVCSCLDGSQGLSCPILNPCDRDEDYPCGDGDCFQIAQGSEYRCLCPDMSEGQSCPGPCDGNPCENGVCTVAGASFTCMCNNGWTKGGNSEICNVQVLPCNPPCSDNGQCIEVSGSYMCQCVSGWTGQTCGTPVLPCNPPCSDNGQCIEVNGSYMCRCVSGWTGQTCDTPVSTCNPPCSVNAQCVPVGGSLVCQCNSGWAGPPTCEIDTTPCDPNPCVNGACMQNSNGFICECDAGYIGEICDTEVTCESESFDCGIGGTCQVSGGGRPFCICNDGYQGTMCEIAPCDNNPCLNRGTCALDTSTRSGYRCQCRNGYYGRDCENDPCTNYNCGSNGNCVLNGIQPTCSCDNGYTGPRCQTWNCDGFCVNGGTCEIRPNGMAACSCPKEWSGEKCSEDVNECGSNDGKQDPINCNNGICRNTNGGFTCTCLTGFGDRCNNTDVDECASNPCQGNNTHCLNLVGKYECVCEDGRTGINCDQKDFCYNNPCDEKGTSKCLSVMKTEGGETLCVCNKGYRGNTCTEKVGNAGTGKSTSTLDDLPLDPWWLALIGLIVLLFIIFIIIVVCTQCYNNSSGYDDGKYYKA